jgi:hypothetical protein
LLAALVEFAAISASPRLFSYQNISPCGTSENTRARVIRRPPTTSRAARGKPPARRPVIALP